MLPWVRTAPLETPEVPEVKRITAGSAGSRSTSGALSPAAASASKRDLRDPEPLGRLRHERRAFGVEDNCRGGDRAEPLLDLGRSQQDVDRDHDRPEPERAEVRLDERRRVRQHDRHAVSGPDAAPRELCRGALDACAELRVGDVRPLVDQGRSIRVTGLAEDACEVRVHGSGEQSQVI